MKRRRLISFASSTVAIEYSSPRMSRLVEFLYQYVPAQTHIPPHVTYRLASGSKPGQFVLYRGDTLIYEGDSEAALAEMLVVDTCHHLADQSRGGLLLHAAGLVRQGRGLILPGPMGVGKSTLTAWLLSKEFDYLTDELIFVPQGSSTIQGFMRPLSLKSPSRTVLQGQFGFDRQASHVLSNSQSDLISPASLRIANRLSESSLSLIVFPCYLPTTSFELHSLSKAQTGLMLMQCLINARNLPEQGFPEIIRLARTVPAYRMSYANFDQVGDHIGTLLQSPPYMLLPSIP